ncbi:MAG: META domain-containing protein [Propionibacteriaceae bacterium]|nr:META domain-containing protein [Propionibacteriaceae bacterium]
MALFTLSTLAACTGGASLDAALGDKTWNVTALRVDGQLTPPTPSPEILMLRLVTDPPVEGLPPVVSSGGLNTLGWLVTEDGPGNVTFRQGSGTAIGSTPEVEAQEDRFIALMEQTAHFSVEGDVLTFADADNQPLITFTAA